MAGLMIRRLSWAGVQLHAGDDTAVIDVLEDVEPLLQWLGPPAAPMYRAPGNGSHVVAAVTHMHRDHVDAGAISRLLRPGAELLRPPPMEGEFMEAAGTLAAEQGLSEAGVPSRSVEPYETVERGTFTLTALPGADGNGDPQYHWLVRAGGVSVLHAGDTLWHGGWWRMRMRHGPVDVLFAPINAPTISFPHRQPPSELPAVMGPVEAVAAAAILEARLLVPIHYGLFDNPPHYAPARDVERRLLVEADRRHVEVCTPEAGEELSIRARPQ